MNMKTQQGRKPQRPIRSESVDAPHRRFFHTLGNRSRLEVIYALRDQSKNVTELTQKLPYKQSTISHNLKRLVDCQFVYVERRGLYRYYRLNTETIEPLLELMDKHIHTYCSSKCGCD